VRRCIGWYRHITLAILAHAFLAAMAAAAAKKEEPQRSWRRWRPPPWQKSAASWPSTTIAAANAH